MRLQHVKNPDLGPVASRRSLVIELIQPFIASALDVSQRGIRFRDRGKIGRQEKPSAFRPGSVCATGKSQHAGDSRVGIYNDAAIVTDPGCLPLQWFPPTALPRFAAVHRRLGAPYSSASDTQKQALRGKIRLRETMPARSTVVISEIEGRPCDQNSGGNESLDLFRVQAALAMMVANAGRKGVSRPVRHAIDE